jgi:hypothetical protein
MSEIVAWSVPRRLTLTYENLTLINSTAPTSTAARWPPARRGYKRHIADRPALGAIRFEDGLLALQYLLDLGDGQQVPVERIDTIVLYSIGSDSK